MFNEMILSGKQPNKSAFPIVRKACATLVSLEKGKYMLAKLLISAFRMKSSWAWHL